MIYMIWNIVLLICVPVESGMSFFGYESIQKSHVSKDHITKQNSLLPREEVLGKRERDKSEKSEKNGEKRRKRMTERKKKNGG